MESLVVANDLFHPHGHRIQTLVNYLEAAAPVRKFSLVPPGLGPDGQQAPGGSILRGWPGRAIAGRHPSIWMVGSTLAVRRAPLPGVLGPLANRALLRRALYSTNPSQTVALAQGPVPGIVCAERGFRFVYDHADHYGQGRVGLFHKRVLGSWQRRAIQSASAVSCAGPALLTQAVDSGARAATLHPNGVDIRRFGLTREESPRPSLLYVGGIERDCGLDAALHALRGLEAGVSLTVVGDGPSRRGLMRLADRLGVSTRVMWKGSVSRELTPQVMATAWIGLAAFPPTGWNRYAFHLKILEYMAAGLPFVTSDVGDAAQVAAESRAGLVTSLQPEIFAACLGGLLADSNLRATMSAMGRQTAARYDWDVVGPRFARWVTATMAELG